LRLQEAFIETENAWPPENQAFADAASQAIVTRRSSVQADRYGPWVAATTSPRSRDLEENEGAVSATHGPIPKRAR
jgi:hypothetical protein